MSVPPGGVRSVYKKYTVGSTGIWERIRRFFAIDPERSTGVPYIAQYRNPAPGHLPQPPYHDPVTIPSGDIADNPYWKRDNRRAYPKLSVVTQSDAAGMLLLGTAAAPRIADGAAGEKQLVEIKEQNLVDVLKQVGNSGLLLANGLPPVPGQAVQWTQQTGSWAAYPNKYPCRTFT
ncbi:hypothetical protein H072_4505 [Dactylellina haptotyla CBS 200.50]|uniref:NADH-ubiquinone oxidoreductase 21.3 kDa subunit n=1 Tax=Dactylellina haptotyla (strain CBS 200.50) TaxID=1284197 RepID=S8AKB8_DACHA|nr:hypothetical protein H072_4505 [Dactylellina haptotyla CBS 200.50]